MPSIGRIIRKLRTGNPHKDGFAKSTLKYDRDGLKTVHAAPFMEDPHFLKAYAAGKATGSWNLWEIQWRAFVCCWAAKQTSTLEGDFVECGVKLGGYSRTVIEYLDDFASLGKRFFLPETYDGLVDELITDDERMAGISAAKYEPCYEQVCRTFAPYDFVRIIQGRVPDTLDQADAEKVCYLSIDMNCVVPEIAAAEFFWDRLVPGAIIVLDDYGFQNHVNQQIAFDEWAAKHNTQVLALPTGQGLILK